MTLFFTCDREFSFHERFIIIVLPGVMVLSKRITGNSMPLVFMILTIPKMKRNTVQLDRVRAIAKYLHVKLFAGRVSQESGVCSIIGYCKTRGRCDSSTDNTQNNKLLVAESRRGKATSYVVNKEKRETRIRKKNEVNNLLCLFQATVQTKLIKKIPEMCQL